MRIAHKAMPFDNFYLGCKHLFVSIRDKHVKELTIYSVFSAEWQAQN